MCNSLQISCSPVRPGGESARDRLEITSALIDQLTLREQIAVERVADYVARTVIVRDKHSKEIRPNWNASSRGQLSTPRLAPDNYHASSDGTLGEPLILTHDSVLPQTRNP